MARPSLRENLIAAAVEQFHGRGYAATGVKDITDAAGAPKGSFYNHFKSKEALLHELLEEFRLRLKAEVNRPPGDGEDPQVHPPRPLSPSG